MLTAQILVFPNTDNVVSIIYKCEKFQHTKTSSVILSNFMNIGLDDNYKLTLIQKVYLKFCLRKRIHLANSAEL